MRNQLTIYLFLFIVITSCTTEQSKIPEQSKMPEQSELSKIPEPTDEVIEKFYQSIFSNNTDVVLQMIGSEFPGNFEPKYKVTPLQAAIWQNNIEVVKKLVENKANINSKKHSAIEEASKYGTYEILKYLILKKGNLNNRAFNIAKNYKCAKLLLKNGASQNSGDVQGKLNFYLEAVNRNDIQAIKLLELNKDELNYNACDGNTALIIAIKNNNAELVDFLIKKGVDVQKPETYDCGDDIWYGEIPIQIARGNNFHEIVTLLELRQKE